MRVAAVTGLSGSGKTTLIEALIRLYVARGERVAAIKHTHHALNRENRGDTARFLAAGAEPVILAGDREAIVWRGTEATQIAYDVPSDLLAHTSPAGIVLVEGFKEYGGWPHIEPRQSAPEAAAMLDRIWRSS